jgi:bifunctional UDP-N-acetylglucosamine pyrophosphorylase/glucosamine-1-phosphate N-acetyltransferase
MKHLFIKTLKIFKTCALLTVFTVAISNQLWAKNLSSVVILAAGQGTRMKSETPKVLQKVDGKPMIFHILKQIHQVTPNAPVAVVVGYKKDQVVSYIANEPTFKEMNISFITQGQQNGTGHAARSAIDSTWGKSRIAEGAAILILPGDLPLIPEKLISEILHPLEDGFALRLLICSFDHPKGYGRVIRTTPGREVLKIVEEKDANLEQRKIKEVALSTYLFNSQFLSESLRLLTTDNTQAEYYLTDLIEIANRQKKKIDVLTWPEQNDVKNINTPEELIEANAIMKERNHRISN